MGLIDLVYDLHVIITILVKRKKNCDSGIAD